MPPKGQPRPIVRDVTHQLASVLGHSDLVIVEGEPGVGKTAAVGSLARLIEEAPREVPPVLRGRRVMITDASRLCQDTRYHMYLEGRIGEVARIGTEEKVLLCLEDLPRATTAGAHSSDPQGSVLGLLMPYVGTGLKLLGTATPAGMEFLRARMPWVLDQALVMPLAPAGEDEAVNLLVSASGEAGWGLDEAGARALRATCARFMPNRKMPGAAFEVLRMALVSGRYAATTVPTAIAARTGLSPEVVDDSVPLSAARVRARLARRVLGQPEAVEAAVRPIIAIKAGLVEPGRPAGVLLLLGPTGVGKTELAKAVAEILFGAEDRLARFDLSEYSTQDSVQRLLGPGGLPAAAERGPAVILLDEVEKAHNQVHMVLLQLMGDARLTGLDGRTADFTGSVVVMTSNVLSDLYRAKPPSLLAPTRSGLPSELAIRALAARVAPEFLGRIHDVVAMRSLEPETVRRIAEREVARLDTLPGLRERGIVVQLAAGMWEILIRAGYRPELGARPMQQAVRHLAGGPVAAAVAARPTLGDRALRVHPDGMVTIHRRRSGRPPGSSRIPPVSGARRG